MQVLEKRRNSVLYFKPFFYEELSTKVCRLFVNTEKIIACQYPEKKASDTEYDTEKLLGESGTSLRRHS